MSVLPGQIKMRSNGPGSFIIGGNNGQSQNEKINHSFLPSNYHANEQVPYALYQKIAFNSYQNQYQQHNMRDNANLNYVKKDITESEETDRNDKDA
jgi:hypothetical protein